MSIAFDAGPGASLRMPEVTLEPVGVGRAVGENPAEENVLAALARTGAAAGARPRRRGRTRSETLSPVGRFRDPVKIREKRKPRAY